MNRVSLASIVGVGVLVALAPSPARAGGDAANIESPPQSKKMRLLADKEQARTSATPADERARTQRELRRRIGKPPGAVINVYNTWTHEFVAVDAGRAAALSAERINRFLRCHFTNHEIQMDPRLFASLIEAANHFKVDRVDIVSGFRAPKYNLVLRKKGRRVARNSQHTVGGAIDFRLPGVSTKKLRNWARRRKLGGVGYYRHDRFVHIDTGPVRYWAE